MSWLLSFPFMQTKKNCSFAQSLCLPATVPSRRDKSLTRPELLSWNCVMSSACAWHLIMMNFRTNIGWGTMVEEEVAEMATTLMSSDLECSRHRASPLSSCCESACKRDNFQISSCALSKWASPLMAVYHGTPNTELCELNKQLEN